MTRDKKKTSFYLTEEARSAIDECYIEVLHLLRRQVDKTQFQEALVKAGLRHRDEIVKIMEESR